MRLSVASALTVLVISASLTSAAAPATAPAAAKPQQSRYGGGDGLSKQTAVVIRAGGEASATQAEYAWIKEHYPGSTPISQALTPWDTDGKRYERITIHASSGDSVVLWFEISARFKQQ
ncbi:MAG TPA: hypothetical protein VLX90_18805 [Steroidobacteraceae bacterium]|nr:hypothetical protein [Steroidobacteraceae bacterium]